MTDSTESTNVLKPLGIAVITALIALFEGRVVFLLIVAGYRAAEDSFGFVWTHFFNFTTVTNEGLIIDGFVLVVAVIVAMAVVFICGGVLALLDWIFDAPTRKKADADNTW